MDDRTCTTPGCDKAHRARGLCITHYNATRRKPNPTAQFGCTMCGSTFTAERARANRYKNLYCSTACRDRGRSAQGKQVAVWQPVPALHKAIATMPQHRTHTPRTFVAGNCKRCARTYIDRQTTARFCSKACSKRWHRDERKARLGYTVPRATRTLIYARDKGICQLCNHPVDMRAPTGHPQSPSLDHIICQSWTLIPDHSPDNLRLAHMICNARRGNEATRTDVRQSA